MRKSIVIICLSVVVFCLWLLLHRPAQQQTANGANSGSIDQPNQSQPIVVTSNLANPNPPPPPHWTNAPAHLSEIEKSNLLQQRLLELWQGPINFYGKVIDENSNTVRGATISFGWVEEPTETGNRNTNTMSDAEGLFSLTNQRGLSLGVSVGKEGYYPSRNETFNYGSLKGESFSPDQENPVIFHLLKKGQGVELITSKNGLRASVSVRVPKDNTLVRMDLLQKQVSASGQIGISQNKPPFQGATNWSFSLSIPDGGLVENQDEFQFAAPESGYQPTVEYAFTKGATNWTTQVTKQFYIAFGQPRKYGWLRIESNLAQETIFLTYAINPTGSRNLEPKQ